MIRTPAWPGQLLEASLAGLQTGAFLLRLSSGGEQGAARRCSISPYKGSALLLLSNPNYFPEAPPPDTAALGVRVSASEF